jgi:SAM-dependent methyltransferase
MSIQGQVRDRIKAGLSAVGQIPALVPILFDDRVRRVLGRLPGAGSLYGIGFHRRHPFDVANGTDTSGQVLVEEMSIRPDHPAFPHTVAYGGSQPSVIRTAINALPGVAGATFIDFGTGKGRPLLVATEFPFRDIVGVELSGELAGIARANAAIIAARHPQRTRARVEIGDAGTFPLPAGDLVLFFFFPFRAAVTAQIVASIERALEQERRAIYVIFVNPIDGALFDASPKLLRRWARTVVHAREERGYSPEGDDLVIIWQGGAAPPPTERADAQFVAPPGQRARLVP